MPESQISTVWYVSKMSFLKSDKNHRTMGSDVEMRVSSRAFTLL